MSTHTDGATADDLGTALRALMQTHGFAPCEHRDEVLRFHSLADRLIPGPVATPEALATVQQKTGSSLFLYVNASGEDEAFLGLFAFSPEGEKAFASGAFSSLSPAPAHIAPPSTETRLGYVWGFGGLRPASGFRLLRALRHMRCALFAHITLAARAASPEGRALMAPFGHTASLHDPSLFLSPALASAAEHRV